MDIKSAYCKLLKKYNFKEYERPQNLDKLIAKYIKEFTDSCENPAIWCYGRHTKMLMTDFIFQLKKIKYIIDIQMAGEVHSGFQIISPEEIEGKHIDGVIISSMLYRKDIIEQIKNEHPNVKYFDMYEYLEKDGICLKHSYYQQYHVYARYNVINQKQQQLKKEKSNELYHSLIEEYIQIKDFRMATQKALEWEQFNKGEWNDGLSEALEVLYEMELEIMSSVSEKNAVMLCIDGLRRKDLLNGKLPKLYNYMQLNGCFYSNAYSMSTSTYESILPAYGENADLRTKYYQSNTLATDSCRFVNEALKQGRNIYFYTDAAEFVENDNIIRRNGMMSLTEKMWWFLLDSREETKGLFYLHPLYESHYSYPNPYTESDIIIEGSNIMFDYLEKNGGKIRTDYYKQQQDALRYIDDSLTPFLERLSCPMVLFADHGNILINQKENLEDIDYTKFTFHEDLVQIPLFVMMPGQQEKQDSRLVSLMEINNIVVSLINGQMYECVHPNHIKVVRSRIYNPDFIYLYKMNKKEQGLCAFEVFIFEEGYKLVVYENAVIELYNLKDEKIHDIQLQDLLLSRIKNEVTVCKI